MAAVTKYMLAPAGSVGNVTSASITPADHENAQVAVQFVVEAAGTTITWKVQGSMDAPTLGDAAANWYDWVYFTDASDTLSVATIASTIVGAKIIFLDQANTCRGYRSTRLVPTANTGITYRAELYVFAGNAGN
jgi:hypothetical protein